MGICYYADDLNDHYWLLYRCAVKRKEIKGEYTTDERLDKTGRDHPVYLGSRLWFYIPDCEDCPYFVDKNETDEYARKLLESRGVILP